MRLSREGINSGRWNEAFIENTIKKYKNGLKKVWVCGPPPMSETFEHYLFDLEDKEGIEYEIL